MNISQKIPPRIANMLLGALKGGVVPRVGLEHITVGRSAEIAAILQDIDNVSGGGGSFRFISGRYGAGKSFLLQTIRNYATAKGFVVMDAELSAERRFAGTKGHGLATYRELVKNLSTKSKPDGGALPLVLERWIGAIAADDAADVNAKIFETMRALEGMVCGFHFAKAIEAYWQAHCSDDAEKKVNALSWLRGEFHNRKEARDALGINFIPADDNWYDFLKLFAGFSVQAGFLGLIVMIDEVGNISRIPHGISRQNNYEKILTIYNDTLGGGAAHLGFLLGGTPQSLEDRHRGLYSYEALRTRLTEGHFASDTLQDAQAPIIRLNMLSQEEMYVLIEKLRDIHAHTHKYETTISHEDMLFFLEIEYNRVGAGTHITPREIIRDFLELAGIAHQNPTASVRDILGGHGFVYQPGGLDDGIADGFADLEF